MMKPLLKIVIPIILVALIILLIGLFIPKSKVYRNSVFIKQPYYFVWAEITNHFMEAEWRSDLESTEQLEDKDGMAVWKEKYTNGDSLILWTSTMSANKIYRRLIINNPDYEGEWLIALSENDTGTVVKMAIERRIENPITRLKYWVENPPSRVDTYLGDLKKKFESMDDSGTMMY